MRLLIKQAVSRALAKFNVSGSDNNLICISSFLSQLQIYLKVL